MTVNSSEADVRPAPADDPPGVDVAAFEAWLSHEHPDVRGTAPLALTLIAGGRSNLTYRVDGAAFPLILRRGPLGHAQATAHDMGREATVMSALRDTAVPVPRVIAASAEPAGGVDAPFYLMERVEGTVLRSRRDNAALTVAQRRAVSFELADTLAALHAIDPASIGLADFGRPAGYLQRQLRRWRTQREGSRSRDLPAVDRLADALEAELPAESAAALLHGDFRLDNVIVDPASGRIAGVLDWEMATLGDPLADLALFGIYWDLGRHARELTRALPSAVSEEDGYPGFGELVERYARTRGIDVPELHWYSAFSAFKLAVIAEGIHYRYTLGKTAGGGFERIGEGVEPLGRLGLGLLDGSVGHSIEGAR